MPPARSAAKPKTPRQTKINFGAATNGSGQKSKQKKPSNGNILNFFKKVEIEEALFIDQPLGASEGPLVPKLEVETQDTDNDDLFGGDDVYGDEEDLSPSRFNEDLEPSKRRKLSHDGPDTLIKNEPNISPEKHKSISPSAVEPQTKQGKAKRGPFLDDSDSEDDAPANENTKQEAREQSLDVPPAKVENSPGPPVLLRDNSCSVISPVANLKQEDSVYENFKDLDELGEGIDEDFNDTEDGEEYRYMRFMQEQARLEAEEAGGIPPGDITDDLAAAESMAARCPLCEASLAGITPDQANAHVNGCLDGNPIPLPAPSPPARASESGPMLALAPRSQLSGENTVEAPEVSKRFAKAAVPRPGQANPISLGGGTINKTGSAFSKLMSGHAEDAAWASAAAAEHSSRGKPAYERTCPFYKIMPGFFICVDAFRYGAVKGCNAYFLSHFHSDHYIGLTANWSHGPIYCSKVTGSLVRSQLRTAAKWVKEIEFEETIEIPGTQGVTVTMISANHCPGSSLFLFEKTIGNGPGSRKQRILHCGDFRACPAQVKHPLLKPDVIDAISGKTKQQKVDVCYLDTTYLNPRYSFPPQEDVIRACAEFCKTISGDPLATDDAYDALQREKGTESVSKFFVKEPSCNEDPNATMPEMPADGKPKHRLLVICGTYSIGKERICKAIAQALQTKIYASAAKIRIVQQLGDPELSALLTTDPREAQVHMQMLMEIRAETLQEYLNGYKPHFSRIVGFRPSGWNFRNPSSTAKAVSATVSPSSVPSAQILHGPAWRTGFGARDFVAQRGSTREAMCFGVPYSEHSSFRELALFIMALRVEKVVPTVNVGSEQSRKRMKAWLDRWLSERRRGGIVRVLEEPVEGPNADARGEGGGGSTKAKGKMDKEDGALWDGKDGRGGAVYW